MQHTVIFDRSNPDYDSLIVDGEEVLVDSFLTADDIFEALQVVDLDGEFKIEIKEMEDDEEELDAY